MAPAVFLLSVLFTLALSSPLLPEASIQECSLVRKPWRPTLLASCSHPQPEASRSSMSEQESPVPAPMAACDALSLSPIFYSRMEKGGMGRAFSWRVRYPGCCVPGSCHFRSDVISLMAMFPSGVCSSHQGQGTKESFSGSRVASEVLAFLVMCLIYLLTLGLGSLNPIDFSDHVSSGGQVA